MSQKARPRAHDIECRTAGARELARRRDEATLLNGSDRLRELGLERRQLPARKHPHNRLVRTLQEHVHDLDLAGSGTQCGQRVNKPLDCVIVLERLFGREALEAIRLVVDDESAPVRLVEDVESPRSSTPSCTNAKGRSAVAPSSSAIRLARLDPQ